MMNKVEIGTILLVLAGNHIQYENWKREKYKEYKSYGFDPRYLPASNIIYLKYKDCFFIGGNKWENGGYKDEMFKYFTSNNIQELI